MTKIKPVGLMFDNVNHPRHYQGTNGLEVLDVINNFIENPVDYYIGNVIKYVCRYKKKNGIEDLKKARVYLDLAIDRMESDQ